MTDCEMCGKTNIQPIKVEVEGVKMTICKACAPYGKRIATSTANKRPRTFFTKSRTRPSNPDENKRIVKNYSFLIKETREQKNLKQEDFAKKINEKESLLHKVESGHIKPSFRLARKIGRFLHINLIENIPKIDADIPLASTSKQNGLTMEELVLQAMKKTKK